MALKYQQMKVLQNPYISYCSEIKIPSTKRQMLFFCTTNPTSTADYLQRFPFPVFPPSTVCCGKSFSQQSSRYWSTLGIVSCTTNEDENRAWPNSVQVPSAHRGLQITILAASLSQINEHFFILHSGLLLNSLVCQKIGAQCTHIV